VLPAANQFIIRVIWSYKVSQLC